MKMHLQGTAGLHVISRHGSGFVVVNGHKHECTLLLSPQTLNTDDWPATMAELETRHIERIARAAPEIVLVGTGSRLRYPHPALWAPLAEAQIGFEVMDTGAACRTYNILVGEGRAVCALLVLADPA